MNQLFWYWRGCDSKIRSLFNTEAERFFLKNNGNQSFFLVLTDDFSILKTKKISIHLIIAGIGIISCLDCTESKQ